MLGEFSKVGGWTASPWRDAKAETQDLLAPFRGEVESLAGTKYASFQATQYCRSTQVVAGTNIRYQFKVAVTYGGGEEEEGEGEQATKSLPVDIDVEITQFVPLSGDAEAFRLTAAPGLDVAASASDGEPGEASAKEDNEEEGVAAPAGGSAEEGSPAGGESLEDLCGLLISQINGSTWLEQNPPTGKSIWAKEEGDDDAGSGQ
eukprot:g4267.t1